MPKNAVLPARVAILTVLFLVAGPVSRAQVPGLDIEQVNKAGGLSSADRKVLGEALDALLEKICAAPSAEEIQGASQKLVAIYQAFGERLQFQVAEEVASRAGPAMEKLQEKLRPLREVNLAVAVSQMPQAPVQPLLEKFLVHPNPAVRYFGWRGYRGLRGLLLVLGQGKDETMFRSLSDRLAAERSAPVIGAMLQMIQMPPVRPAYLPQEEFLRFHRKAFEILQAAWAPRCRDVLAGEGPIADACRSGVSAAVNFTAVFPEEAQKHKAVLQMLVEMAWCSSKAYDRALKGQDEAAVQARISHAQLLRDCEGAMNYLTKQQKNLIGGPLSNPDERDRGAAVRLGVMEWVAQLKDEGVTDPESKYAAPATESAPAGASAR